MEMLWRWIKLNGHLTIPTQNPWEFLLGRYFVKSTECDFENSNKEVEFNIAATSEHIRLESVSGEMHWRLPIVFPDTAYGVLQSGEVFVRETSGTGWSGNLHTLEFQLKVLPYSQFEMKKSEFYQSAQADQPDHTEICVFKGEIYSLPDSK
jgi:hypothetical protein